MFFSPFDPITSTVRQEGSFPFTVPRPLTAADHRRIRTGARRERSLLLRQPAAALTPILRHYETACQKGQTRVQKELDDYIGHIFDRRAAAQEILESTAPVLLDGPDAAELTGASGLQRQEILARIHAAQNAAAAAERHANLVEQARVQAVVIEKDAALAGHQAALAFELWAKAFHELVALHASYAAGASKVNPALLDGIPFRPVEQVSPVSAFALEAPPTITRRALGRATDNTPSTGPSPTPHHPTTTEGEQA